LTRVSIGAELAGMTLIVTLCALENGSSTTRVATSWYRPPFIIMLMEVGWEFDAAGAALAGAAVPAPLALPPDGAARPRPLALPPDGAAGVHAPRSDTPVTTVAARKLVSKKSRRVRGRIAPKIVGPAFQWRQNTRQPARFGPTRSTLMRSSTRRSRCMAAR